MLDLPLDNIALRCAPLKTVREVVALLDTLEQLDVLGLAKERGAEYAMTKAARVVELAHHCLRQQQAVRRDDVTIMLRRRDEGSPGHAAGVSCRNPRCEQKERARTRTRVCAYR